MEVKITKDFWVSKPFGPSIARTKIPDEILNELNNYIDNLLIILISYLLITQTYIMIF